MTARTYEMVTTKQTLNKVSAASMPFNWSINPYRGCAHGCSFCYAREFQSYLGKEADDSFQNHILVKKNAAEALEAQLARALRRAGGDFDKLAQQIGDVAIGTATDPYQAAEAKQHITRQCLEVLAEYRIPTSITTRSPLILRDMDILSRMRLSSINISVNTMKADVVRKLEPEAPLPEQRLRTVAALSGEGLPAGVFAAPILPCLTDSAVDLNQLFAAIRDSRAAFVMTSLLRLTPGVKAWYMASLATHYPELVRKYAELYEGTYARKDYRVRLANQLEALRIQYKLGEHPPKLQLEPELNILAAAAPPCDEPEQLAFGF